MSSPLPMKSKSNNDKILPFRLTISFFQQYGYVVQKNHSDHENTILSAQTFLNQQNIQLTTIASYQHEQNWNAMFKQLMLNFDLCYQVSNSIQVICSTIYSSPTNDQ